MNQSVFFLESREESRGPARIFAHSSLVVTV